MLYPFLLIISNSQSLEKFLSSLEIGLESRGNKRLSESSWTTQKNVLHLFLSKINDVLGLIYIEIFTLSDIRECLYSYRIEIYYFCHILTCFTFCAAKLRRKSEIAKNKHKHLFCIYQHKCKNSTFIRQLQIKGRKNLFLNEKFGSY